MPIIESIHLYAQINQYWDLVKRTLEEIFGVDPAHADALRREVKTWPAQEQLLFYHAEPLDVAADLAGRPPTQHEVESYTKRAASLGWYVGWTP
jgi:hypothetical protein